MNRRNQIRRIGVLCSMMVLIAGLMVLRLVDLQIVNGAAYRQEAERKILRTYEQPASRGEILDCYGRPLVSNALGFSITFDYYSWDSKLQNDVILQICAITDAAGLTHADSLPVTTTAPFAYTFASQEEAAAQDLISYFEDNEKNWRIPIEDAPEDAAEEDKYIVRTLDNTSAEELMDLLRDRYDIPASYTDEEARKVAGVRYEMRQQEFSSYNNLFTFASDVSVETVSLVEERSSELPGVTISVDDVRQYDTTYAAHVLGRVGKIYREEYEELRSQGYSLNDTLGKDGLEKAYVLTNGPFSLGAWNHGQSLLLNKNEQYHEAEDVYPATVRYVIQPEAETGEALLAGTLDAAALRPDQLEAAREQAFHLEVMDDTIEYVWLNNSVTALSNASIRRALRDALAYDRIAEQLDKTICTPAQGYIAPDAILKGTEPYRNADNSRAVTTDRDKARRELSEGMAALSLTAMPALKVLCADDAYSINLARYVIQSWQSHLTLYFTLDPVPADQLRARLQVGNYQIAIGAQTGGSLYAMGGLAAFLSDAPAGNLAKYSSARFDEQYKKLSVGDVSRADVDALEKLLVEECPSIPLDFQKRTIGIPAKNSGIILRPFNGGAYGAAVDFRHAGKLD